MAAGPFFYAPTCYIVASLLSAASGAGGVFVSACATEGQDVFPELNFRTPPLLALRFPSSRRIRAEPLPKSFPCKTLSRR